LETRHNPRVDLGDLAHKPEPFILRPGNEQVAIETVDAGSERTVCVDETDDVGVDLSRQSGLHNPHRLSIRDPKTLEPLGFNSTLMHRFADTRSPAVDDHHVDSHVVEHRDVVGKRASQTLVHHRRAPVLDHNRLAAMCLDERHRLGEDPSLPHRAGNPGFPAIGWGVSGAHDRSALKRT
jgi:hypothetical protein